MSAWKPTQGAPAWVANAGRWVLVRVIYENGLAWVTRADGASGEIKLTELEESPLKSGGGKRVDALYALERKDAQIGRLERELRDEKKLNATVLKERDMYGQRWRHWETQANAILPDAEAWREHCRSIEGAARMQDRRELRGCLSCPREWLDEGDGPCPYCGHEGTEIRTSFFSESVKELSKGKS